MKADIVDKFVDFKTSANKLSGLSGLWQNSTPGLWLANTRHCSLVIKTSLFVTLDALPMASKAWRRNKTSWLDNEASHFSSGELMITCRSSGLLHLHANRQPRAASPWQAPIFSALSCPRSTKGSLEGFYLRLRLNFLVCWQKKKKNPQPIKAALHYSYRPCISHAEL